MIEIQSTLPPLMDIRPATPAGREAQPAMTESKTVKMRTRTLDFYYGDNHVLHHVDFDIFSNSVTALIGPSGCGKTTFLRTLNRMNDQIPGIRHTGEVSIDGQDIYG